MSHHDLSAGIAEKSIETECIDVIYPQVSLIDQNVENKINSMIEQMVNSLVPTDVEDAEGCTVNVTGRYEITVNQDGILSLWIDVFTIRRMAANGITIRDSLTVDLGTGKSYELYELFKPGANDRIVISDIIKREIKKRDLPTITEFITITDNEGYYLTPTDLVIYFQEITYFPHAAGIQEFPIPFVVLANMVRPGTPIAKLLNA
ncbi:DUF3298 and DUF4163 domain-containing protein [Metallumcola ferriviriculae]|uniref:DUF3298 and DUF4163 domain-containing protein n=1 Tax=Metallumcola ferriviriculae TaxID=3039180 RepID=A0AAU0USD5_9FIRM|nr:DUF3298 and DUF4163 domain-containing protein [Desulfitibacteraceae bacterium MK1]